MTVSFLIVLAQLTDSYIRFLAFAEKMSPEVKLQLWKKHFFWGAASVILYNFLFAAFAINAVIYKLILMSGWLPYFINEVKFIRKGLPQHVFVFGMGVVCSLSQHTICAMIILKMFAGMSESELILIEAAGYLLLFTIFLPIFGHCFIKLLPSREFFDIRPTGIYIAILPLIIVSGHLIRLADDVLVHSWTERVSRIYLPLVFFFFYRYILIAAKNFYDVQKLERNKRRLAEKLNRLKEYNELMQENQKKISVMRHDLRHSYNLIHAMLESGDIEKVREHIKKQEEALKAEHE